ncbi:9521_t:CDS:1, partial [Gigaspora rosea]
LSDKSFIRSNSPETENKSTDAESENENSTYNNVNLGLNNISKKRGWSWKYFEMEKVSKSVQEFNTICNVNDNTGKKCNAQLKVSGGPTLILISHLLNHHGITQNRPGYNNVDK